MPKVTNPMALITGATKGIGRAIAERLAVAGYDLLLTARNAQALEAFKTQLETHHPNIDIHYQEGDVSDRSQLSRLIQWADQTAPSLDVLVNNVGIFRPVSVLDESDEDFETQMCVNYFAPHFFARAVGRNMRKNRKGHIINISSIASRQPVSAAGTYTVTKYAVRGLTHVLRDELRPFGVKVTEIVPGSTLTPSWEGTPVQANEFVLPADIAEAIMACLCMSEGANVDEVVIKPKFGNS